MALHIGWAQTEITPERPVLVRGYSYGRVSEGVLDPLTATALVLESLSEEQSGTQTILVSCDLIVITNELRDEIRRQVRQREPKIEAEHIIVNATHTHNAPELRCVEDSTTIVGIPLSELGAMEPAEYVNFAARRIADAIVEAYRRRRPGGISWGLGSVVVSHNRISSYFGAGNTGGHGSRGASAFSTGARRSSGPYSLMYGKTDDPDFSHMEGYVDHSFDLLCTWDEGSKLTGVVANLSCPSQVGGDPFKLSADFWHETRLELRRRYGEGLYVLPQCAPAGDQNSPHPYRKKAEDRMLRLKGRTKRQEIACRIADAVGELLPWVAKCIEWDPVHLHRVKEVRLPRRMVTEAEVKEAEAELPALRAAFEESLSKARALPVEQREPRWYVEPTRAYWVYRRAQQVIERYRRQERLTDEVIEVHGVRLGELGLATNPFELYLDFGIQMQARSPFVQTFLVQLVGPGSYVPTQRSVEGGAYGAVPASSLVGPEGGRALVEETLALLWELWEAGSVSKTA